MNCAHTYNEQKEVCCNAAYKFLFIAKKTF